MKDDVQATQVPWWSVIGPTVSRGSKVLSDSGW